MRATGEARVLLDRRHDRRHGNLSRGLGQPVSAGPATGALDETGAPQRHEKLFEIGKRQALALRDDRQRYGTIIGMTGKIRHGHDRVPAFGRQFHVSNLRTVVAPSGGGIQTCASLACIRHPGLC